MTSMLLSVWCALRCDDPLFQRFLGVTDKTAAAEIVRRKCGLKSRAEIDKDPAARARFDEIIRQPFTDFYNRHEGQTP
ncbi:MAG: hypothetical protein V4641_01850 [Pseudomonadota bacterium]